MANDWSKYEVEPDNGSFDRAMKTDFNKYPEQPQQQGGLLDKYGELYDRFHENIGGKYLGAFGAGVFEPLINAGISAINAPLQLAGQDRINHWDLHKYLPEDYSKAASFAGNLFLPLGVGGKAIQAINKIPIPKGIPSYYGNIAKNSAASALIGENEEGNRLLATLLGGGATALHGVQSKEVGKNILNKLSSAKKEFKNAYESLFESLKKSGVKKIEHGITPGSFKEVGSGFNKYASKVDKLKHSKNATPQQIHDAQSDVGKFIRKLEEKGTRLTPEESESLTKAIKLRDTLKKYFEKGIKGAEQENVYKNISEGYAKEVAPFLNQKAIRQALLKPFQTGRINPEDLPGQLNKISGTPFRNALGSQFPELTINKYLPKVSDIAGKYAVPITAGSFGLKKLIEALSGSQQGSNNATY